MRIPPLFKCQAWGCDKKATQTFNELKDRYCDYHHDLLEKAVKINMKWIAEQDEKYLRGELKDTKDLR